MEEVQLFLEVKNLKKIYTPRIGKSNVTALSDISFDVKCGDYIAIMGESGSGKTTLLNILAALDTPTEGEVFLEGKPLSKLRKDDVAAFRRENLGFVFQDFNLLDTFCLKDNILLPLVLSRINIKEMEQRVKAIAIKLKIENLLHKFPYEVSGGQKQRAAVARALITNPTILLADEPTGALDSRSTDQLLDVLDEINQDGQTILMVTHSIKCASYAKRVVLIKDGVIFDEIVKNNKSRQGMYELVSDTLAKISY